MGFGMTVKVDGITKIDSIIANVSDLPKDLTPQFQEVRGVVQSVITKNFEAQGRPDGWDALADSTIRDRLRLGFGEGPIGGRTGEMYMSLTGDGDNTINEIEAQRAEFGAIGPKVAAFSHGREGQPARSVLFLDADDKAAIIRPFRMAVHSTLTKSASEFFGGK